ncbi:MAG: DUF4364 family protein [Ruminococcaceae bacterium]|nr:DUF4364 family protein [Oscillospiraceae bacterium]
MEKNIWENVYYRLNDPVEIKLAVLYTLSYADIPVSDVELKHCMIEATRVDFMELCNVLEQLLGENHIKTVWRDEMDKYVLTPSGEDMISMFANKLLPSVKKGLKQSVDQYYRNERSRKSLRCDVQPLGDNLYNVELELREGKKILLSLELFAGSKQHGLLMCRRFREDPYGFYENIIGLLEIKEDREPIEL